MWGWQLLYVFTSALYVVTSPIPKQYLIQGYHNNPAVKRFQEYIQIDTSREENVKYAVDFWQRQASEIGVPFAVYEPAGKPICVLTWQGADPDLPSIMLNSHMDVVPVDEADWTYPPYSAYIDDNGDIYGRGTQDTKDIGIQYLEAIRKLKNDNVTLQRTLHLTFMPDEETGGNRGMIPFIKTPEFDALNVGFALDEGMATPDDTLYAFYQDRRPWILQYTVHGTGGHGILMPEGSAMEKAQKLIDIVMKYRSEQRSIMETKAPQDYGSYTSININIVKGGIAQNVIPTKVFVVVDIRLSNTTDAEELLQLVEQWGGQSGNDTELEFVRHVTESAGTSMGDDNPYWIAMKEAINEMGNEVIPLVCPAATDMIPLRSRGIPCIGFAPKTHTISRIHTADEYLNVNTFLRGIDVYTHLLKKLGNLSAE